MRVRAARIFSRGIQVVAGAAVSVRAFACRLALQSSASAGIASRKIQRGPVNSSTIRGTP